MTKKKKTIFIEGAISSEFIAKSIAKHQVKTQIGAHNIFLGQVREDQIDNKTVIAIDYTTDIETAENTMHEIREAAFNQFNLSCLHVYHSLGTVKAGELCLFVFVSAPSRKNVFTAIEFLVEEIKQKLPIFGKETFNDHSHQWKKNT